jgi:translocator protein
MSPTYSWYSSLIKPSFAPPAWVFGPVWTVLYIIIAITFIRVFYLAFTKIIPGVVIIPFILNLFFNFSFTPLQFGLQNNYLAALDILLVLATLIWAIIAIWPYSRTLAYAQVPYLLWVAFATVLQLTVTWLNA